MKKITRIAALLAAGALLFGAVGCSSGGGSGEEGTGQNGGNGGNGGGNGGGGNGGGGGGGDDGYTGPGSADSWNFVSKGDSEWAAVIVAGEDTPSASDGITKELADDINIKGEKDSLTLTVLASGDEALFKYGDSGNVPAAYAYDDTNLGLRVKGVAMKITGVKGKTGVKIEWAALNASREIQIWKGTDSKVDSKAAVASGEQLEGDGNRKDKPYTQEDFETLINGGAGADFYIVATNHVFIRSITLTDEADAAEGKVTVKIPSFETGFAVESNITSRDYTIGYATSISAGDLTSKVKADENLADLMDGLLAVVQADVNKVLTAGGAEADSVKATSDDIDFLYYESAEAWADDSEEPLSTIPAGATVYLDYDTLDALWTRVENEIASLDPNTPTVVNAVWNLVGGANASKNATIAAFGNTNTALSSNEVITPDSGSGATLTIIANKDNKIKYNNGLQQSAGKQEQDFAELKVDGACTVKIKAKGSSSSFTNENINSFSINGKNEFKVGGSNGAEADADEHEYTYTAESAETIKITAIGMKFTSITCSQ